MLTKNLWQPLVAMIAPPSCLSCPDEVWLSKPGFCCACSLLIDEDSSVEAAFVYGGPLAAAVRAMKYGDRYDAVDVLAELWASRLVNLRGRVDAVVCVPSDPLRQTTRDYDSLALMAWHIARRLDTSLSSNLLVKARPTPAQASLPATVRKENLRDAFSVSPSRPSGRRILLLDDVFTTGATIKAARAALTAAGFEVTVRTLARTPAQNEL